jgi:hypothetical protein
MNILTEQADGKGPKGTLLAAYSTPVRFGGGAGRKGGTIRPRLRPTLLYTIQGKEPQGIALPCRGIHPCLLPESKGHGHGSQAVTSHLASTGPHMLTSAWGSVTDHR